MSAPAVLAQLGALPFPVVLWPAVFGLGLYLILTAQPIGKPHPDPRERLRRLDVDERVRMDLERRTVRPIFASPLLEGMLRPVLDDLGRALRTGLGRFGIGGGDALERRLRVARPGVEVVQFFGEKVAAALVGAAVFPLMNGLGVHPFGVWPAWASAAGFGLGFFGPDWELGRRLARHRSDIVMELPVLLDMMVIACSAGLALEQALMTVARQSEGLVGLELRRVTREVALGQRNVVEALEAMAARHGTPELARFVGQLRAAHDQGIPLVQALSSQREALRERKRLRIVEEGGKGTVRMIVPVALFILPALFVVLLLPATVDLMRLGS